MVLLMRAAGDVRRCVRAVRSVHAARVCSRGRQRVAGAHQPGALGHAQLAGSQCAVQIDTAVRDPFQQGLQAGNVRVRDLHVRVDQAEHFQHTADLLELHELLRRNSFSVDGNLAYGLAVCDTLRQRRK